MPLDYFAELFHRPLDRDLVLPWYDAGRFLAAPLANANGFALDAGLSSGRGAMGPDTSRATGAATTWATDHAAAEEEKIMVSDRRIVAAVRLPCCLILPVRVGRSCHATA